MINIEEFRKMEKLSIDLFAFAQVCDREAGNAEERRFAQRVLDLSCELNDKVRELERGKNQG